MNAISSLSCKRMCAEFWANEDPLPLAPFRPYLEVMKGRFPIFIILAAISVVVLMLLSLDPGQSERLADMRRAVTLQGEARETAMFVIFVAIAGFAAYLTFTRR